MTDEYAALSGQQLAERRRALIRALDFPPLGLPEWRRKQIKRDNDDKREQAARYDAELVRRLTGGRHEVD